MLPILMTAVNAVCPIVLLILLGYVLRQKGMLTESFVKSGGKLVYGFRFVFVYFENAYCSLGKSFLRIRSFFFCTC